MRSELLALSALALVSCATTGNAPRVFSAPPDELFTAAWLALENEGVQVTQHDRVQGRLAWAGGEVNVASRGADEALTLTPPDARLLDAVERRARATLTAWETSPEWTYDAHRNLLYVRGFSVELPREWRSLGFDASRRRVTVQERRGRGSDNPTLLAQLERREPRPSVAKTLQAAVGVLLDGVELRFDEDDGVRRDALGLHGEASVRLKSGPVDVVWLASQRAVGDFQVTLVLACPAERTAECEALWRTVQKSALTPAR